MAASHENDLLTEKVIGFAIEVHRQLGPGLLESAYEECLCYELAQNAIGYRRQVPLPIYDWTAAIEWMWWLKIRSSWS
jgi:GxxExxY protein